MPAPLRLVSCPLDPAADEAALVEALLTGLPPGARVLLVGAPDGTPSWLADALEAVEVEAVRSDPPVQPPGALFADSVPPAASALDGYDAVVVDSASLPERASATLAALAGALAPGGRLLVQVPAGCTRSLGEWVRMLGNAGLMLRDVREPAHGGLAGSIFVAEAEWAPGA